MCLILVLLSAGVAAAQTAGNPAPFRQAGVCSRCHVAQVLEWSTSAHRGATVSCEDCHGASAAHVVNERNEAKPDRHSRGAPFAGLCLSCHTQGCLKVRRRDGCGECHHVHALFNPSEKQQPDSTHLAEDDQLRRFEAHLSQGEAHLASGRWKVAADEFEAALRLYPKHRHASARLMLCRRRLNPNLLGFEALDGRTDAETGLPVRVRVKGLTIEMALVAGGDVNIGDDNLPGSRPAHTVRIEPYYLATTEVTQRTWTEFGAQNRSTHRGPDLPVHDVSWRDALEWIARLNAGVPGAGFRLPTEAEWEFAASSGARASPLPLIAWFRDNSSVSESSGFRELQAYSLHPAGTRKADTRGIHDLAGNVWEWCSSLMKPYPYDARDGRELVDAPGLRVLRGGGYADGAAYLSPSFRHGERPDRRLPFNGIRLVRSVPGP